jgi:hypothetical protein
MKADAISPSKKREKEALQYAEEYFRGASRYLTRDGSKQVVGQVLSPAQFLEMPYQGRRGSAEEGAAAALKGLKDNPKDTLKNKALVGILRDYAANLLERDMPLPPGLGVFAAAALRNPNILRIRGPSPADLGYRNALIGQAMARIVHRWKFPATRNMEALTVAVSAASIAAQALSKVGIRLTEKAVNVIWAEQQQLDRES